ncbi:two-component sensor histidine kinase [Hyphomicrobium methylovorum]|uniref:ATP-binding protein n=1 Tax=Hyphomicrobium methylovorum TaxID=84 RepID=UPI0015E786CC|nr:ATP-binding protein [Hyphomicrobium methylovorum]MBA2126622.1 two-component sensor histidine kinase [Hyphomicrobium methylovorum]
MSLRSRERLSIRRFGIIAFCVATPVAALLTLYAAEPFRSVILALCGATIGAAVIAIWRSDALSDDMLEMIVKRTRSEKVLPWPEVVAAMPDPAVVVDRSSIIQSYNEPARAVFDLLQAGKSLEHVSRDPELLESVSAVLENGERRTSRLLPHGVLGRRFIVTISALGNTEHRKARAVLITMHDQSEQHRLLEMRTDFIANASHELRTPLATLHGFIETLQGPARNDEGARDRFLAIMADQANRMKRLIDDLLLLSRAEEKANLKPTGTVDVNGLLADVGRALAPIAAARDIKITIANTPEPLVALGDRDELFQVFHNLIENSIKYGRESGKVTVTPEFKPSSKDAASGSTPHAIVSVSDNGPGISPEHLPRLTERFYRVNAEHSRRVGGTGLGLAITKHILTRHSAELSVESVVGQGTTFRVTLPALKYNCNSIS